VPDYALIAVSSVDSWCKVPRDPVADESLGGAHGRGAMCAMTTMTRMQALPNTMASCFNMSCPSETQLLIHVGNETQDCSTAGTNVSFTGYYGNIICPDPAIVCGVLRYPANVGGESKSDKLATGAIVAIVVVVVVVVAVVVVVIVYVCVKRRRDADEKLSHLNP
jgi:hypothetical protein